MIKKINECPLKETKFVDGALVEGVSYKTLAVGDMPMKQYKLDKEEKKILKDFEDGKYVAVKNSKAEMEELKKMAKATLNKIYGINERTAKQSQ